MKIFEMYTEETAPEASKEYIEDSMKRFGFLPNLHAVMSASPAVINGYKALGSIFATTSFTPVEQQIVLLTVSRIHECSYCLAAHSKIAENTKVPSDVIADIRNGNKLTDEKYEALREFTTSMVNNRGWVSEDEINNFLNAGYENHQILEIILGVSYKVVSNYINHIAETPLDETFSSHAWKNPNT